MATYYLTSADVGAPSLTGQNGSACTVWDWILNTNGGLAIAFTGTNRRAYTMPDGGILQLYHDSSASGDARVAIVRGAESASSISSYTDVYPLTTQVSDANSNIRVSGTADATARAWYALLDTTNNVFIFITQSDTGAWISGVFIYGGKSALAADSYATMIYVRNAGNTPAVNSNCALEFAAPFGNVNGRLYIKRSRDGTIKSSRAGLLPYGSTLSAALGNGPTYPHPDDGKLRVDRVYACEHYSQSSTVGTACEEKRLYVPRLFVPRHAVGSYASFSVGEEFTNGAYDSQFSTTAKFRIFPIGSAAGSSGAWVLQTDGDWSVPTGL